MLRLLAGFSSIVFSGLLFASTPSPLTGLTLLVLGENHMSFKDGLITTLPDQLKQQGALVFSYGACGALPDDWLKIKYAPCGAFRMDGGPVRERPEIGATTQTIRDLIGKHSPDLIVLVMGENLIGKPEQEIPKAQINRSISALNNEIKGHGISCVWVGPARDERSDSNARKKQNARLTEFSDFLSTSVTPCTYIDSLHLSKSGEWQTSDGYFFDRTGYESWAKGITEAITSPEILPAIKSSITTHPHR